MVLKSIYFMFFVCIFLFGMMACSSKPKDKFANLSTDEFERLIENENVQRLDVRTVAEYSEGHIPGSININIMDDSFSSLADQVLDKSQPVAVYCKSGRRSRNAARLLVKKGYTVYNLDKGILNWIELGKDIEK